MRRMLYNQTNTDISVVNFAFDLHFDMPWLIYFNTVDFNTVLGCDFQELKVCISTP